MTANAWFIPGWIQRRHLGDGSCIISWSIDTPISEPVPAALPISLSLALVVAELFDDMDVSNVKFVIANPRRNSKEEQLVYAHTKILSAQSDYFRTSALTKSRVSNI